MRSSSLSIALACVALGVAHANAEPVGPALTPVVSIQGGAVVGLRDGDLSVFKGIAFAAPPVRELRWKPPQDVAPRAITDPMTIQRETTQAPD